MYPFPPSGATSLTAILWHVVMLALALAAVVSVFRAEYRPARPWSWLPWLGAIVLVLLSIPYAAAAPSGVLPFIAGYGFFVLIVAGTGLVRSIIRLIRGQKTGSAWGSITAMILLGAIIFVLLPGVPNAREAARRSMCTGRFKKVAIASHDWESQHGRLPDAVYVTESGTPRSWRVELLPYLFSQDLRDQYHDDDPWTSAANTSVARAPVEHFTCPANPEPRDAQGRLFSAIAFVTGPGACFPDGRGLPLDEITDGTSATLLAVEACGQRIIWTEPRDVDVARLPVGINLPGQTSGASHGLISSYHPNVANVAMADGSCRALSEQIDPTVLHALTTANGDEPLDQRGF